MTVDTRLFTADELLRLPDDGYRYELVEGELLRMSPAGGKHGRISHRISQRLGVYVEQHQLGIVYSSETGFLLTTSPDTVRAPDVAFDLRERAVDTDGYLPGAPDLAVEVLSPSDLYSEVVQKTNQYLRAGTRAVIVVDPWKRVVQVHRLSGTETVTTTVTDTLSVDDVVPGWKLTLDDLFSA
ncbi:MAG TPA: Uma2 family endonuclease [Thermoanaerobaculia bacterium]|jgi:Uma2 family endonuclease